MPGKIQIGNFSMSWGAKRSYDEELHTINGSILQSILAEGNLTDERVTIRQALKIATVYACINVIARTISSLPVGIFTEEGGKKTARTDHKAYYPLAHEPNGYMTSPNFVLTIVIHALAWGSGFAKIIRDSRENPVAFEIWEPWEVTITKQGGEVYYTYKGETLHSSEVLHYRYCTLDGICPISPILQNATTMGMAIKLDRYASLILGAQPPGVLSYEGNLDPTQRAENRKSWTEGAKGSVKVLSGKWNYQPIMAPGDETQFNVTKDKNQQELCSIWQVPPTFIQNFTRATYTNAEQSDLVYAKHTITPIIRMMEQENNMKLFFEREKKNTYTKYNLNGLLRGDLAARQAFYQSMVNSGIYLRNEARSLEDLNEYEGGDVPIMQGAMIPADKEGIDALRKKMETEVIPSAKPVNGKSHSNGQAVLN